MSCVSDRGGVVLCRDGTYSVVDQGGMSDDEDLGGGRGKNSKLSTEAK